MQIILDVVAQTNTSIQILSLFFSVKNKLLLLSKSLKEKVLHFLMKKLLQIYWIEVEDNEDDGMP